MIAHASCSGGGTSVAGGYGGVPKTRRHKGNRQHPCKISCITDEPVQ